MTLHDSPLQPVHEVARQLQLAPVLARRPRVLEDEGRQERAELGDLQSRVEIFQLSVVVGRLLETGFYELFEGVMGGRRLCVLISIGRVLACRRRGWGRGGAAVRLQSWLQGERFGHSSAKLCALRSLGSRSAHTTAVWCAVAAGEAAGARDSARQSAIAQVARRAQLDRRKWGMEVLRSLTSMRVNGATVNCALARWSRVVLILSIL